MLRCVNRPGGETYISEQDFRAPIHIGKGHSESGMLLVNIMNPTAGFFDGDRVETRVFVDDGARLVLGTPAASRVYRARSGRIAANHQEFHVGEGAFLEWNPEVFIPHSGASYAQSTRIILHPAADLLFFEWLAPGRVARGEIFAYRKLRWELDVEIASRLVLRERYNLEPENHSLEALRLRFPAAHYLTVHAAGRMTRNWPSSALDELNDGEVSLGHGPVADGLHIIRALCANSMAARELSAKLRELLYAAAEMKAPALGRVPS